MKKCNINVNVWLASPEYIKNEKNISKPLLTSRFIFLSLWFFSWFIKVDYSAKIQITFHDFDLEISKTCLPYDYVKVSDMCGKKKKWSENIGSGDNVEGYCGNMTSFIVQTRCQNARVEFRSDDSITGRGFNATFEIIPVPSELKIYYYSTFYPALPPSISLLLHSYSLPPSIYPSIPPSTFLLSASIRPSPSSFCLSLSISQPSLYQFFHPSIHPFSCIIGMREQTKNLSCHGLF